MVSPVAAGLPWLELVSGTALCIGFMTTAAAWLIGIQLVGFSLLMVVVLVAQIPIDDCGCFGNLGIRETPLHVLIRDLILLGILASVIVRQHDAWGIDAWADGTRLNVVCSAGRVHKCLPHWAPGLSNRAIPLCHNLSVILAILLPDKPGWPHLLRRI